MTIFHELNQESVLAYHVQGYFKRNLVNSKIVRLEGRIFESQGNFL